MVTFKNDGYDLLRRCLAGLHGIHGADAEVMLKLLHRDSKFNASEVIDICRELNIPNGREAYHILSRLEREKLVWRLQKQNGNRKPITYERISPDFLQNELEENLEQLKKETSLLMEAAHYESEDAEETSKFLATERQVINTALEMKKIGFKCDIFLKYKIDMFAPVEKSYQRFMKKLKRNKVEIKVGKEADVILLSKDSKYLVIPLCKQYKDHASGEFTFNGVQIGNDDLHKFLEKSLK